MPWPPVSSMQIFALTIELLKPLRGLKNKPQERITSGRNDQKNSKSWLEAKDRTRRRLHTWLRQTTKECRLQPSELRKLLIAAEYRSGLVESYQVAKPLFFFNNLPTVLNLIEALLKDSSTVQCAQSPMHLVESAAPSAISRLHCSMNFGSRK